MQMSSLVCLLPKFLINSLEQSGFAVFSNDHPLMHQAIFAQVGHNHRGERTETAVLAPESRVESLMNPSKHLNLLKFP